jgi:hypothetical protein
LDQDAGSTHSRIQALSYGNGAESRNGQDHKKGRQKRGDEARPTIHMTIWRISTQRTRSTLELQQSKKTTRSYLTYIGKDHRSREAIKGGGTKTNYNSKARGKDPDGVRTSTTSNSRKNLPKFFRVPH